MTEVSENPFDRSISIALTLLLIYFMLEALKVHFDLITAPGPLDPRENQLWMFTDLLAHGHNPYNPRFLPAYVNVYGIVEPLVALPFAKMLGGDSLLLERIISAACIYGSAALLVVYARRLGLPWLAAMGIAGSTIILLVNSLAVTGKIDAFGTLLAVATFVLAHRCQFSMTALFAAAAIGVAALFTKVYFVYGFVIVIGYTFLFISMRRAILAGLAFGAIAVLAGITATWAASLYLDLTFGIAAAIAENSHSMSSVRSALRLFYIVLNTWPLWVLAAACAGAALAVPAGAMAKNIFGPVQRVWRSLQVADLSRGLCSTTVDYAMFAFVVGGLSSFFLEMHSSGGRNYYYQVLIPVALPFLATIVVHFNPLPQPWARHFGALACIATLATVFVTADTPHRNFHTFPRVQSASQWLPLKQVLDGAKDVLNTPEVANLVHARNLPVYNTGSADFFPTPEDLAPGAPMTEKKKIWDGFHRRRRPQGESQRVRRDPHLERRRKFCHPPGHRSLIPHCLHSPAPLGFL